MWLGWNGSSTVTVDEQRLIRYRHCMVKEPLREAKSRRGMVALNVWVPRALHAALIRTRIKDRISINQVIREALELWFQRKARG